MVSHTLMRNHLSLSDGLKTAYLIHFDENPVQEKTHQIHYQAPSLVSIDEIRKTRQDKYNTR